MKRFLLLPLLALTLGATGSNPGNSSPLVAYAGSLTPPASTTAPSRPLVIERTVVAPQPVQAPQRAVRAVAEVGGGNGFIMAGNNCVACVKAMTGRSQNGNAGTWKASHSTPHVGDIMIWRPGQQGAGSAGHVGVVKGVNPDGTVNIAHCNFPGKTVFASTGLFW